MHSIQFCRLPDRTEHTRLTRHLEGALWAGWGSCELPLMVFSGLQGGKTIRIERWKSCQPKGDRRNTVCELGSIIVAEGRKPFYPINRSRGILVKCLAQVLPLLQFFNPIIRPAFQVILVVWIAADQFIVYPLMVLVGHANGTPTPNNIYFNKLFPVHGNSAWAW